MSEINCNESRVLNLYLDMPFRGAWTARVESDDDIVPVGAATITIHKENGDLSTFSGTVTWGTTWEGRSKYTVVGGAGTLNRVLAAQNYVGHGLPLNVLLVMEKILVDFSVTPPVAEVLDVDTLAMLATKTLPLWHVGAQERGRCVGNLTDALGLNWRILDNGQLSLFEDTWPVVDFEPYVVDPGDDGVSRTITIAPDGAPYRPGTVILGRQVSRVSYTCTPDATRGTLYYLQAGV